MAACGTRWRRRGYRIAAVLFAILIQVVNGYEELYTISQLSPKSSISSQEELEAVLQTSQTENLAISIEPSLKFDDIEDLQIEDISDEEEKEDHIIVARSAAPDIRESRSINIHEIPSSNNNEIDNDFELHNKRKYYEIHPTKTLEYHYHSDDDELVLSSEGFGDKFNFKFPGEDHRVPRARALASLGPKIRPTAVQPIFATANLRDEGRQNSEIQNIITGIVKLLNGNVNVQANTQVLNARPGRPMASRINNRGPPRISDVPPLPDFEIPPTFSFHPTKTPPPYPFDRPQHHGANLPEQIVPPVSSLRPGFHRPMPPWQRPRPRPPNRRPNPNLPIYKPTPQPPPIDIPNLDESPPEEEAAINDNETSHSENNIHNDVGEKEPVPVANTPETNTTLDTAKDDDLTTVLDTTTSITTEASTTTTTTSTTTTSSTTTTTTTPAPTTSTTTEKSTTKTTTEKLKEVTTEKGTTTTEKPKIEKPLKVDKDKKKDILTNEKEKQSKEKNRISDEKLSNKTSDINIAQQVIQSSIVDTSSTISIDAPTPTQGLITHAPTNNATTIASVIDSSIINSQSLPTSQGIQYQPYRPRPGIVLDDPDFKPQGSRYRPEASVITAAETKLPGYGEIFDVTVSAIQGPGEKGASVHIENVHPISGHVEHDDIIISASGDQGFVSIDGKRTYLNLFDTATVAGVVAPVKPTQVQSLPHTVQASAGSPLGTGVAIPADDVEIVKRPTQHQSAPTSRPHLPYQRPRTTVRIDTCIVGDDSTCDAAQNEKCRTESGISSCQCRPGYARRIHRDPCRRVVSLLLNLRVDRLYDKNMSWDAKLGDKESDLYQQLSYEAVRAIDSAFSMTPFSDDFVSGSVNSIHTGDQDHQGVFVNFTVLMQETAETLRPAVAADVQKHLLGVIRRRSNNVGASALWVDSPAGSVLPLKDLDECLSPEFNDCHQLASCTNTWGGFRCACPDTTLDAHPGSTTLGGRDCRSCANSHCNDRGTCKYANGQPYCSCSSGYYGSTCEVDGEVVGVSVGASLAAALIIALTLAALLSWSRKWSREQKAMGMGSPVFNYMAASTIKTPPVGQPPYQVTLEERMRWAQIAEAMAQNNLYAEPAQVMPTRPSSAIFGGYPTLPPIPMPRLGVHHGTMSTVAPRVNTSSSHLNLYGYTNHMATESSGSEASSHAPDRTDLLVPRPKSRARSMHNQTGIYYDVEYENAPEPIYGSKGIPLSTYTVSRGPPFYRA